MNGTPETPVNGNANGVRKVASTLAMKPKYAVVRAALAHASPIILDAEKTTEKCISLIHEAADNGADLVVFPETFLPAFPYWSPLLEPAEAHEFFIAMSKTSVYPDGKEVNAIRSVAKERNIMVSLGISEKARYSTATMFNSNLIIDGNGEVVVHHRKLVPTFYEKLTWTPGDGHGLRVAELPITTSEGGQPIKFSNLICGENTNALARYSMIAQGTNFHITSWPAKSIMGGASANPNSTPEKGAGAPKYGKFDNIHLNRVRCGAACVEGKCYGAINSAYMSSEMIDTMVRMAPEHARQKMRTAFTNASQGESAFLDPSGAVYPGFIVDKATGAKVEIESVRDEEGILYADMDMEATIEGKQYHDIVGMYQRFDVFDVTVNRARKLPATFV